MFSIIVVSLNTKKKFEKTIKSILKQNIKNYEIIVIDGKSTDGTLHLIKKFDLKINKLHVGRDNGIYFAMNKGIEMASKKWTIFMNSGDIFYRKNTLKNIRNFLKNKKTDVLVGNSIVYDGNIFLKRKSKKLLVNSLESSFSHQSCVVKTSLIKKNKFNTSFKIAADFNFFVNLLRNKKKFIYVNQIFSINEAGGLSDKRRINAIREFYIVNKYNKNINYKLIRYSLLICYQILSRVIKIFITKNFANKIKKSIN